MTTWLSRVMAVVFTFTVLAPTDLLAQKTPVKRKNTSTGTLTHKVQKAVEESREQYLERLQEEYATAKDVFALTKVLYEMHNPPHAITFDPAQLQADLDEISKAPPKYLPDTTFINPAYQAYMTRKNIKATQQARQQADEMINRITNAEESWENLMLYLDPILGQPDNLISTVAVAEILGNTLDSNQPEIIAEMDLLELQLRAIFRLRGLENQPKDAKPQDETERVLTGTDNNLQKIQAIGTLRMLLLKVNQYYQRTYQKNPLFERRNQSNVAYQRVNTGKDSNPALTTKGNQSTVHQLFFPEMYDKMMSDFLQAIQQIKEKNPKENSAEYQNMVLWMEFAVAAAILYRPETIERIVHIFDEGSKSTKFLQHYTTALNVVFQTIREHLQFSFVASLPTDIETVDLLLSFTDPNTYSLPTRIFALESISAFIQQQPKEERQHIMDLVKQSSLAPTAPALFHRVATIPLGTQLAVAARTVDIYASLNSANYKTYGLDAEQMRMLSDKLALIYNRVANADLKLEHPDWDPVLYNDITRTKRGFSTIKNTYTEIPRLRPLNSPLMLEAWTYNGNGGGSGDLHLRTFYGAGRKSNGEWIEMRLDNGKNPHKAKNDLDMAILTFASEVLLWVFGGEIFALLGRSFRVARGATLALPKATRAAVNANKGRRMLAFGVEVKKGVRFASLHKTTVANGISVAATRVEPVTKSVPVASKGKEVATLTKGLDVPPSPLGASSVPLLTGTKLSKPLSWWHNIRRKWTGVEYKYTVEEPVTEAVASMRGFNNQTLFGAARSPVEKWTIMSHRPGFDFQAATLSGAKAERLSGGIHSWDDWRYLMRNARTEQGLRLSVATDPLKPFSSWWSSNFTPLFGARTASSQIYNENRVIGATARAFEKDAVKEAGHGTFDYWKYTDSGWVRINQQEFMKLGDCLKAAGKEVVPDYYELLGISRNATQKEIKRAYKKKVLEAHPDRMGSEEWTKQLNHAYSALKNTASRAAYDAKLASSASTGSVIVLPKSPEGVSLAVTSPVGQNVPKGFSPMTKSAKGFGFHEGNWGAVPEQLAVHLSRTGQTKVLGAPYMFSNRWVRGVAGNTVFFGGLALSDQALGGSFQNYITDNAAKEVEKAQKKFGDAYDPDLLKKDEEAANETLELLKEQGVIVPASSVLDDVRGAESPSSIGSTFSFPLIAAWNGLSKTQLGGFFGIKTPFMDTGTMARLESGANRLQVNRLVRRYNEAKDKKSVDQVYENIMTIWNDVSSSFESSFAQLDMLAGTGKFASEKQEMSALLASSKKEFERIYNGNGDSADKFTQLDAAVENFIQKCQQLDQALAQKWQSWQFHNLITNVEVDWNNDLTSLAEEVADESQRAVLSEQMNQVYRTALAELRALYKQGVPLEDPRVIACYQEMQLKVMGIVPPQKQAQSAENDTKDYVYAAMMWELDRMEAQAKKDNINISAFINDWRVGMEEIRRSAKNITEMNMQIRDLSVQIHKKYENDEAYRLFEQKHGASAVSADEEEDKSELFPDETTETPSSLY